MAAKGKRPMRALTAGDKIEAIQRVNDGESKASVARDIGVPESTLRGWCKNEDKLRYMSSRRSSPETDKSSDGEVGEKRARTASPAPPSPAPADLSTRRPSPRPQPEPGARVSMSAISPLSGLAPLPPLPASHLPLSFNDIATNLSLIAQLSPGLGALTAAPASRALRSVRSPKPVHNGALNLSDKHRNKLHHADPYDRRTKSNHGNKDVVDEAVWYWLKTQQAMLDLTAAPNPLHLPKTPEHTLTASKHMPASAPLTSHMDYNRNTWFWQYYKQFGGAMPPPDGKLKSASQVPREKTENILYSQLVKGKTHEEEMSGRAPTEAREERTENVQPLVASTPAISPGQEHKEPSHERPLEHSKNHAKARTVLDKLLFNNNEYSMHEAQPGGPWEMGAAEALEHGDKFLSWLEGSGDPSVTRVHVAQLRALLHNLRTRRTARAPH